MTRAAPPLPPLIAFGEALTDMLRQPGDRWQAAPGGAAWNVARTLCSLGLPATFAGSISSDVLGDQIFSASQASGLDTRFIQRVPCSPLLAMVEAQPLPDYFFIGNNSADLHFDPSLLPSGWIDALEWAHFGGVSLAREPLATRLKEIAQMLKSRGKRISYDPNYRVVMNQHYDSTLQQMCQLADVIKVSDEDLCGLFRSNDPEQGLVRVSGWAPHAWLLRTSGEDGATLYHGSRRWHACPPPVDVVDSVGAGDAAMAGLICSLYSLPRTLSAEGIQSEDTQAKDHLSWAIAAGTAACMSAGAVPPSVRVITALRESIVPAALT